MNKFIVLALAAFVCGAVAVPTPEVEDEASQFAIFEDDATETSYLSEERQVFSDFCLQARDEVKAHFMKNVNKGASLLFQGLSDQILESAEKVKEQQQDAVEKGKDMIHEDARNAGQATTGVIGAIMEGIKSSFYEKVEQIKGAFTKDNIREQVFNGCDDVLANVLPTLESKLEETKSELAQSVSDEASKQVISETTLANVGCLMAGRVSKVSRSCQKLKEITPATLAALGL